MQFTTSSYSLGMTPTELTNISKKSKSIRLDEKIAGGDTRYLDVNTWLPAAAKEYGISPDLNDYIIIPSPSCITEIPNTNGDCFSKEELLSFKVSHGMLTYRTFVGKPMFVEHQSSDHKQAIGVILDCYLRPLTKFKGNHAIMIKLNAIDRNRNPLLAEEILSKRVNTFSMGMAFSSYTCSFCGNRVGIGFGRECSHTKLKKPTYMNVDGSLVYRNCEGALAIENSVVVNPAYVAAIGDNILTPV